MSKSLFDCALLFTKRLFGPKKNKIPRPQKPRRNRLALEALEDRTLLSASGTEPNVPSPLMEAGRYVVQEAVNYVSNYESTVAAVSRMVANLEQQVLLADTRLESTAVQTVEQFIQQTLFPNSAENSPSAPSSSIAPGQLGGLKPIGHASSNEPTITSGAPLAYEGNLSPKDESEQTVSTQPLTTTSGTWTQLTNAAPDSVGIGTMILLSNGDVMAQGGGGTGLYPSTAWYELTPNASGSYVNGTWSSLASMSIARTFYASNVLPNGNFFIQGGEYSSAGSFTNTGETYNPVTNTWTPNANFLYNNFGDDPSEWLAPILCTRCCESRINRYRCVLGPA